MDSLFCLGITSTGICGAGALWSPYSVLGLYKAVKASWRSKAHVLVWFEPEITDVYKSCWDFINFNLYIGRQNWDL